MIEALVARVFATRNVAHLAHWATRSYAEHKALGKFYEALPGQIDSIVETFQGAYGLIGRVAAVVPPATNFDMAAHLEEETKWIIANCDAITRDNDAIENLVYGLLETYYTTIYKLRNLK